MHLIFLYIVRGDIFGFILSFYKMMYGSGTIEGSQLQWCCSRKTILLH